MHGSPLLRAALVLAVLLALLIPMRSFTAARQKPAPMASATTEATAVHLEIVSTRAPFHFSVAHLGRTIWQGDSPQATIATDVNMPVPQEGIELVLHVDWQSPGESAAKLTVTHGYGAPATGTIWGNGNAEDVLTFQ